MTKARVPGREAGRKVSLKPGLQLEFFGLGMIEFGILTTTRSGYSRIVMRVVQHVTDIT